MQNNISSLAEKTASMPNSELARSFQKGEETQRLCKRPNGTTDNPLIADSKPKFVKQLSLTLEIKENWKYNSTLGT